MKGHGGEATLAASATLTAAWPVSTLLAEPTWLKGTLALLAVIALSGIGARLLALRSWQVLMVQLVCAVLTASGVYGQGHLWHGLPTFETLRFGGTLVTEALATVQAYAAPAPTTPGLAFVVGCSLALVALAVDYLAVTRRSPSLAGLPLLIAFLTGAANSGSSLPVIFFVAAAAMWLVLVARQGSATLRLWATTVAVPRTPVRDRLDAQGASGYVSTARTLGIAALVAAAAMPVVLPHLPPHFLTSGLGRNVLASGNGSGKVGFSLSLDLAADLNSRSTAPVLEYTTADPSPPPLRVAISSFYDSDQGVWPPGRARPPVLSRNPTVPEMTGLATNVPKKRFAMVFQRNLLEQPNLAAPYPLIAADLDGIAWGVDARTQTIRVAERPDSYAASYWRLEPTPAMLQSATAPPLSFEGPLDDAATLDPRSAQTITSLSERLTTGKVSAYDKAMAIQQYLRATGGFTYSLILAPTVRNQSGNEASLDPLTNFLVTKQGYCVQFATAMVMLSRAANIPARMAIGFLPGTGNKGVWTVTASDAHTWPELYLDGIGWTRFEPTPSRAAPPVYAVPTTPGGTPVGTSPGDDATTAVPRNRAPKDLGDSTDLGTSTAAGISPTSVIRWLTRGWGLVLLGSLLGLFGSMVVPTAARWRRRRKLMAARTAAQRVEVQWELLTSSLGDLGIAPAPSRTPRQLLAYYERAADLEGAASEALGRVVQTLERTRYAAAGPATDSLVEDARQVLQAAAATRRPRDRIRAVLWPSTGLAQIRSAKADVVWHVRGPLRDADDVVRRWLLRRP